MNKIIILLMLFIGSTGVSVAGIEECDYINETRFPKEYKECVDGVSIYDDSAISSDNNKDYSQCVPVKTRIIKQKWDTKCGKRGSLFIKASNSNASSVQMKICIEQKNRKWDCGSQGPVKPSQSMGYWACNPTGEYIVQSFVYNKNVHSCFTKDKNTKKPNVNAWEIKTSYR